MARKKLDWEDVRRIGLAMPGVDESTAYGSPALKIRGKLMTCLPTHKSAEPGSLAVSLSFEQRDGLLAEAPDTYYVKEHYLNYPIVLVRLARISQDVLADLLGMAWRFASDRRPSAKRKAPPSG